MSLSTPLSPKKQHHTTKERLDSASSIACPTSPASADFSFLPTQKIFRQTKTSCILLVLTSFRPCDETLNSQIIFLINTLGFF